MPSRRQSKELPQKAAEADDGARRDANSGHEGSAGLRPSLPMVAAHAGVSLGTASNVLNRPHLVADATRDRVLRAMEDLDYVPNVGARQLRQGKSQLIGVIVLDIANPFWGEVVRGAEAIAVDAGHVPIVCNAGESILKEDFALRALVEHRVDGLLIAPVARDEDRLERLQQSGIQVVLVDHHSTRPSLRSVAVNDELGGELAARHLLALGHRRIAFVHASTALPWMTDRRTGVVRAFERAGVDVGTGLLDVAVPSLTAQAGEAAVDRMLAAEPPPTAVFCANDLLALGVLRGLGGRGLRVPEDLSLIGYDDVHFAAHLQPSLSTIQQFPYQLGQIGAEQLLSAIGSDRPEMPHHITFEPSLIARDSTAPPKR